MVPAMPLIDFNGLLLLMMLRVLVVLMLLLMWSGNSTGTRDLQVLQGLEGVKRHRHLQKLVARVLNEKDISRDAAG